MLWKEILIFCSLQRAERPETGQVWGWLNGLHRSAGVNLPLQRFSCAFPWWLKAHLCVLCSDFSCYCSLMSLKPNSL